MLAQRTSFAPAARSSAAQFSWPNRAAMEFIPEDIANNETIYPPQDVMDKLQIFEDLGRDLQLYNSEWVRVKTAQ